MNFVEIPNMYYIEHLNDLDTDMRNEFLAKAYIPSNSNCRVRVA